MKEVYLSVLPKLATIFGASLLIGIIIMFGAVLFIVPGIIFGLWLSLTIPVIIVEDTGIIAGMSRSKQLVSGNMGRVFLLELALFVLTAFLVVAFVLIGNLLVAGAEQAMPGAARILVPGFSELLLTLVLSPIASAALMFLYYDLRARKEGSGMEMPPGGESPADNQAGLP